MSSEPSKIINKDLGDISENKVADIAIIDLEYLYTIDSSQFISKGKNTPFNGYKVYGNVSHTLVNGKIVYRR